ncbi:MAG: hypothetical protein DCC58_20360 [Chloroflexi bacterium]|nr:MAG: hypothetical protein DCC58_20360 [Chloroflexota bacterium]
MVHLYAGDDALAATRDGGVRINAFGMTPEAVVVSPCTEIVEHPQWLEAAGSALASRLMQQRDCQRTLECHGRVLGDQ